MLQTFDSESDPSLGGERVKQLRRRLSDQGLDGFIVPRADEHQGEYVPPASNRLQWLTGFSGSAGYAVILRKAAALFVDGRYTVQARQQVDTGVFEILQVPQATLSGWVGAKLAKGQCLGFDPRLHTLAEIERLTDALSPKGIRLKPVPANPVDRIWGRARPKPPQAPVVPHPISLSGRDAGEKLAELRKTLTEAGQDAVVLTQPDSISWLFNVRGSDVAHNPVVLAFAIVPAEGRPELFVDPVKVTPEAHAHLEGIVRLRPPKELAAGLKALKTAKARVRLDADWASSWIARQLGAPSKLIIRAADPCLVPKARKNAAEIKGAREAQRRDGAAVCRFLAWLDRTAPSGNLDEIGAVERLEAFRAETGKLQDLSFDTISGSGPHGAIVHYRVTRATNRRLKSGELFLVDSGGQYRDGTTDITRTIAIGAPSEEMRERFTLVLKGHIAIATARFPKGTRGADLDAFARRALWERGLDFDHGTGHGVGSYLSVHEGPQGISKRGLAVLEPGMIVSNEPGYYREGRYGIRLENLVLVTEPQKIPGGERDMMAFETLTLAPFDRRLIAASLLTGPEREWINAYHARVSKEIGPALDATEKAWLIEATRPIA